MTATKEEVAQLQAFLDAADPDGGRKACPRCGCCEMFQEPCDYCGGEGEVLDEEDDSWGGDEWRACEYCGGKGWWWHCSCDENGQHKTETSNG